MLMNKSLWASQLL